MSTEFFLKISPCKHCGRAEELLFIGRSSGGWKFQLNAIGHRNLTSLDAWVGLFSDEKHVIVDEYGREYSPVDFLAIITQRQRYRGTGPLKFNGQPSGDDYEIL